ncbi:MAG TPA: O-antigen ligase family protein [Polyangiaceae bacterium]|nr:O-antigen ligase family protein [Polyangiaceae bacterium]
MSDEPEADSQAEGPPRRGGARARNEARKSSPSRDAERSSRSPADRSLRALSVLLAATVAGSVLAIGSVHIPVLLVVAAFAITSAALAFHVQAASGRPLPLSLPVATFLALSAYSLLQAAPMPIAWLEAIAPWNADIWSRALDPFGEPSPSWAPLSLDPASSLIEGLKWLVYAAVFASASVLGAHRGAASGVTVVFASAVVAALVTIGHGLLGVTLVYGIYKPAFSVSPWHVGPLLNPNNLAGYLNLGAMCGLGLMLMRRPIVPPWIAGLGVAVAIAVELTSGSRAGSVALLLGIVAMAVLPREASDRSAGRFSSRRVLLLLAATAGGGAVLAALGGSRDTWAELYDQNIQKIEMLRWVTPMLRDFTWLGVGRGAFESVFPAYRVTPGNVVYTHAENFVAQWAAEWGAPVTIAALIAFAIALRPGRLGVRRSAIAAGAWVGLGVLSVQNLFDLGFEIPAICVAACASFGSVWGDAKRRRLPRMTPAPKDPRSSAASGARARWRSLLDRLGDKRAQIAAGAVLAMGLCVIGLAGRFGWRDLAGERSDLREAYEKADLRRPEARAELRGRIRSAMTRRPAEPYFPLLGALTAWRARDRDPLPWLQRTLERDPISGRAHLLLAEVLRDRGALAQALMELRIAAENDSALVAPAALTALRFTKSFTDLMRAVPAGKAGTATLDELAVRLDAMGEAEARSLCDREAILRDPSRVGPRMREALSLLRALDPASGSPLCSDRARCEATIEAHAQALEIAEPRASLAAQVRARKWMADGQPDEAERMLAAECARASDRGACAKLRVEAAAQLKGPDRLAAAVRDYLSAECSKARACADAAHWAGNVRATRGEWGAAMALYSRAAREDPGEDRWLALADAAGRMGAHAQAVEALEKVAQKRGGADPALRKRIEEERSKAAGTMFAP